MNKTFCSLRPFLLLATTSPMMSAKRMKALWFIGRHFVVHLAGRVLRVKGRGKKEFLESYRADGIFPLNATDRQNIFDFSKCQTCKLCDLECPELTTNKSFLPPSFIVDSFSRSLTDFAHYKQASACLSCQICQDICPEQIPIKKIMDFMQRSEQALNQRTAP